MSSRFWKELLEVLEKVWSLMEETCNLTIYILYRFRLALICLKNL